MSRLFLFTVKYPFSRLAECFLAEEFPYISATFSEVYIFPLKYECDPLELPNNCHYTKPILKNKVLSFFRAWFNIHASPILIGEFFKYKVYANRKKFLVWLIGYFTINNILNSQEFKKLKKEITADDVCYFYWGKWSNCIAYFLRNSGCHFISRFHGFGDLWEDSYDGYVPLRTKVMGSLDCCVSISKQGCEFLSEKYPYSKVIYSPLGAFDSGVASKSKDNILRVVSCSTLGALKRVPLIFESLNTLTDVTIEWTHIGGDGAAFSELKKLVQSKSNENLSVVLTGNVVHSDVLDYYRNHPIDVFVNLSTVEGVPVSIMEAISFDIPVVATNVGGTKDIVNESTGILLSANPTPEEVGQAIIEISNSVKQFTPRKFWMSNFNADRNYSCFARYLYSLK